LLDIDNIKDEIEKEKEKIVSKKNSIKEFIIITKDKIKKRITRKNK